MVESTKKNTTKPKVTPGVVMPKAKTGTTVNKTSV